MIWMDGNKDSPIKRDDLNRIWKSMFDQQTKWIANWKDIRDYINPYLGCFEEDTPNDGGRRDSNMINTNAIIASNTFAAGMHNGITSPTRPWLRLTIPDDDVAQLDGVRWWCDDTTSRMLDVIGKSNFYREMHKFYKELGVFGTAAMMIVDDDHTVIRCKTFTIGQYALGCDHTGRIKRFARLLKMNVSEMVDMFGVDNCPSIIKTAYENKQYDQYFDVYHLILPNKDKEPGKIDKWSKAYTSYYWSTLCDDDKYLDLGGFDEFPVMCARWDTVGSDIYGYGPGWYALGDAKSVQVVDEDVHIGIKKGIDPPMVAPADVLSSGGVNTLPNGVTYYQRELGDNAVRAAYQVQLNIDGAISLVERKEQVLNKHFFVDLFRAIEQLQAQGGTISATQIREVIAEKMSLIGPALDNMQNVLSDIVDRVFGIMGRADIIPQPDDSVAEIISEQDMKVEYISIMAQAQKMSGLTALEQLAGFVGNLAQFAPSVADKFDCDEAVDKYADMLGTAPSVIISDDKVAEGRQAKQQQQQKMEQMQQMAQMGTQVAQGAKTLADTPVGQGSALDALMPGLGGK